MQKRKVSLISLCVTFVLCLLFAGLQAFVITPSVASAVGENPIRYGDGINTYYINHWKSGQGNAGADDGEGKWYFGYGDVKESGYSFTQAIRSSSSGDANDPGYTTGTAHQMYAGYNISTRLYSSANTQTMFVWQATEAGKVSFSGLIFKHSGADMEQEVGTTMGLDSKAWLPFDWGSTSVDWVDGQSYTISVWKVEKGGVVRNLSSQTFTNGYIYLVPQTEYSVVEGEKIVFGLKCNSLGSATNESETGTTNHIMFLSSQYTKSLQPAYSFGSNMVLQRGKPVNVYGYSGNPLRPISVTFNGQTKTCTPSANGDWTVTLDSMQTNATGQDMLITDGVDTVKYTNVKVGEVWYCGGQSNMEYSLGALLENRGYSNVFDSNSGIDFTTSPLKDYTEYTNWNQIYVYSTEYYSSNTPDKYGAQSRWLKGGWAKGNSIFDFLGYSAYAVGFALKLQQNLDVPVGIIVNALGGSSVEQWISEETDIANGINATHSSKYGMYNGRTYALNKHTVNGLLWYQGCADDSIAEATKWKKTMKALIGDFRNNHGEVPVIAQLMVEHGEQDGQWMYIRDSILSLMNGTEEERVENYYAINGIGFGSPYELVLAKGNYIHPADKAKLSANAADVATTNVYNISGYNTVAEYPVAVYPKDGNIIIEYAKGVSLKLKTNDSNASAGNYVNNLQITNDGNTWQTVTDATISDNKVIIPNKTASAVRYAGYNVMGPDATTATGRYQDHWRTEDGNWHEFQTWYNSEDTVNLYSSKQGCPDLAVFPILNFAVGTEPTTEYKTFTLQNGVNGTVTVNGIAPKSSYEKDTSLTINITPQQGYKIESVTFGGESINIDNELGFSFTKTITIDTVLFVNYQKITFGAVVSSENGTITGIENGTYYDYGENLTITISANTGYKIKTITLNGTAIDVNEGATTQQLSHQVTSNITLVVTYESTLLQVTVNPIDSQEGTITGITSGNYQAGNAFNNVIITANTGYVIKSVTWAGTPLTITNNKIFTLNLTVGADSTLSITFEKENYQASVINHSLKGSVTGINNGSNYEYGANLTITIRANEEYKIKSITLNGAPVSVTNNKDMTISHTVTGEVSLQVEYDEDIKTFTVTVQNNNKQGSVTGVGSTYKNGETVNVTIIAKKGYQIKTIKFGNENITVTNGTKTTFSKTITEDVTIVVTYEKDTEESSGGCGSKIGGMSTITLSLLATVSAGALIYKKKEN